MTVPVHSLSRNFAAFFRRINPSPSYKKVASRAQNAIRKLIEDKNGPAGDLRIRTFIQGSYGHETAIHTIDDVDVVGLCSLSYKPTAGRNTRDQIFELVGDAIRADRRYSDVVQYGSYSMCVKVELEQIKVEVLPALREAGTTFDHEPFVVFRPREDGGRWGPAFARYHQSACSRKNARSSGNYVPMVKVLKHVRSLEPGLSQKNACSFHLECLLYAIQDTVFAGGPAEYVFRVLKAIAGFTPEVAAASGVMTLSQEAPLFGQREWQLSAYTLFHSRARRWSELAEEAVTASDREEAVEAWQALLGAEYFPKDPE